MKGPYFWKRVGCLVALVVFYVLFRLWTYYFFRNMPY
jgi:hypothetical protein